MEKHPYKIAKITRPIASGIFSRRRLFNLLDKGLNTPVIFITSPPGSGKTSLMTSYLEDRNIQNLWYSIDEGDTDIASFFYYMGLAEKKLTPRRRKSLPLYNPEYSHGIPIFSRRYFEDLFSRLIPMHRSLKKGVVSRFIIVFDNYQEVPDDSEFHAMMYNGLEEVTEGINVFILSRKDPPPTFVRMQVNGRMHLIEWNEIKFTLEEARQLITVKELKELRDDTIRCIYDKTEGWAAGLILLLESLKKDNIEISSLNELSSKRIFPYFMHEIFKKVDSEKQVFLLKTSFLSAMTVQMAEKLTKFRNSEGLLNELYKACCFTEKYIQNEPIYKYHPLFREFLLNKASELLDTDDLLNVKQNAAIILEESGRIEDAANIFLESGNVEGLTMIIRKYAQSLAEQGRYQTLFNWLKFLPEKILSSDPWLTYWMGVCHLPYNPEESLNLFEESFHQLRAKKDTEGAFMSWAGIVESILYSNESLELLDFWFPIVDEMLKELKGFPPRYIEANVMYSMIRALSLRRPSHVNMKKWADHMRGIIQKTTDVDVKIKALINFACYLYSEGNFHELGLILESLEELLKHRDIPSLSLLTFYWIKSAYFNVMSMYEQCQSVVSAGIELSHSLGISVMEYMLSGHGVLSSLKTGDFEASKKYIKRMASTLISAKPWQAGFYYYCAAWGALYQNDMTNALHYSKQCMKLSENTGNPWTLSISYLLNAQVTTSFEEYKKAAKHILKAYSTGIKCKNEFISFICLLTEAYLYLQQGEEVPALKAIRKGLKIGKQKGYINLFMWKPGVMEKVVTKAIECGIEVTYAKNLIRKNTITPDTSHLDIEQWPWPLKIYTFGRFGITKDEKPVHFSGKVQHKPLLLLKALIALGGREIAEPRLADIIWPEAEGDAAHNSFTTTLSRLRQLLGIENAIKFYDGKATLDPRYCWIDVWVFERMIGTVDALWDKALSGGDIMKMIQLAEKALQLYTGSFLSGDNESWIISIRERLRNKFLRNVRRLGLYLESVKELEKAIECYQKGLEVDDLAEEFYQYLMRCYQMVGKQTEAIAIYNRCCKIFSSVLGIEPSPKTEALYKSLCWPS